MYIEGIKYIYKKINKPVIKGLLLDGVFIVKKLFLIIALMLIIMPFAFASSFTRYAFQDYISGSNLNTYALRSSTYNPLNYSLANYSKCSYGTGAKFGAYPESIELNGNHYVGLIVPTSSSLKLIAANCSIMDSISYGGVINSTMGYINQYQSDMPIYVFMIKKTNGTYMVDYYSINNETSKFYLMKTFHPIDLTNHHIKGMTCGCPTNDVCDMLDTKCFFLDTTGDKIYSIKNSNLLLETALNYTTLGVGGDFYNDEGLSYGAVDDYDADGYNEAIFSGVNIGSGVNLKLQYVSKSFASESIETFNSVSLISASLGGQVEANPLQLYSSPCQVGGLASALETCGAARFRVYDGEFYGAWHYVTFVVGNTGTVYILDNPLNYGITPFTYDINGDGYKDVCFSKYSGGINCTSGNGYTITVKNINITLASNTNYLGAFLGNIRGSNTDHEILLSNGQVINILPSVSNNTKFDNTLGSTNEGYITMGDLNHDLINEIIYVDDDTTNIYTTSHTSGTLQNLSVTTTSTSSTTSTTGTNSTTTTTLNSNESLPPILQNFNDNLKTIFGLILIIGIMVVVAIKIREPIIVLAAGAIAAIIGTVLQLFTAGVLIIIILFFLLLVILALTVFKSNGG
jgi:hypothetical protein